MADRAIRIEGLRELERAFRLYGRGMEKGLREALESGAEVVRPEAETLASTNIRRITLPWSRMRVGVTRRTAYVAPAQRGGRARGRPNLAPLLRTQMETALGNNTTRIEAEFEDALADLARMWSRV